MSSSPAAAPAGRFVSLGLKLALGMLAVVLAASALVFVEVTNLGRDSLERSKTTAAAMVADLFALGVAAPLDFGDADAVNVELRHLRANHDVTYAAAWLAGQTHAIAEFARDRGGGHDGLEHDQARLEVFSDRVEVVRQVVTASGKRVGSVALVFSLAPENAAFAALRVRIFWVSLALAVGTVALLLLVARTQILAPLERLADAVRRVERGEATGAVVVRAHDEIGRLARAFNAMNAAIVDRETRLATAHESLQELFDSMRQAIVVFGPDGRMDGKGSRRAREIFGAEPPGRSSSPTSRSSLTGLLAPEARPEIEGKQVVDVLYPSAGANDAEVAALEQWVALAFELGPDAWDELVELAPREVVLRAGTDDERLLELEFRPISYEGALRRVMLLASDETDKRRLQREVRERGEAHDQAMAAMRRLAAGGGEPFVAFLHRARERFDRCEELVTSSERELKVPTLAEILRHAHTLKGEARVFELTELAQAMATLEEQLRRVDDADKANTAAREAIAHAIAASRAILDRSEAMFVAASPIGKAALDRVSVRRQDVSRVVELAGKTGELASLAGRLAARPFGESAALLADKVPTWAQHAGKRADLVVEGREVPVPPQLADVLGGVLTHLVRNAVAHGIEAPAERERAGKAAKGSIRLRCGDGASAAGPTITLEDDGGGLDDDAIRARAAAMGKGVAAVEQLVFESGLSTHEGSHTDLAGLGVGLAAVQLDLSAAGYSITVHTERGRGARFVLEPTDPGATDNGANGGPS